MEKLTPTPTTEIVAREEVIALPKLVTKNGDPVNVLVRAVAIQTLAPIIGGLPDDIGTVAEQQAKSRAKASAERVLEWYGPARRLASHSIDSQFYFDDPVDGKVPYDVLTLPDQAAIFAAILRVSGWSGEETAELRRFPDANPGGGEAGERSGDGVQDGSAAESEAGTWPQIVEGGRASA